MLKMKHKTLLLVSVLIALMAGISSWGGLFVEGLYRDNELVVAAWQGNDLVTLFLMVPMLLVSLFYSLRASKRGRLFWMGSLWYMIYNYMFYLFGAVFNVFFLLYAALFVFSIYALVLALLQTDVQEWSRSFSEKLPYKTVSVFMLMFAALLGGMWIALSLSFVFTGQVHESILQTDHPTAVVFAVDLTLLTPSMIVGGLLLWRKNRWGPVVGSVVLVKATAYGLALIIMTVISYRNIGVLDPFIPLWITLTLGCSIALVFLLRNIGDQ
ncbi:hypothetical protein QMA09_04425 [Planococcus sp. APC 3906]|uniref:hypothetical protein n=1 Tax=Planococcus sp. APC 3906 TaxID=3035194 RepID=UPI0025B3AA20|nr:hypothetical protein [Planococcus sp. APC 3906]MDN3449424.1 hypothetical protein [Planococcus sp. APC 3906]